MVCGLFLLLHFLDGSCALGPIHSGELGFRVGRDAIRIFGPNMANQAGTWETAGEMRPRQLNQQLPGIDVNSIEGTDHR